MAVGISCLPGHLSADPLVLARMEADPAYEAARALWNPPKDESYVVYQGKFFPGVMVDRTLQRMPFMDIVQNLAPDLKKQHYIPATDFDTADLVLVVHWGVTVGADRASALFTYSLDTQTQQANATEGFNRDLADHEANGGGPIEFSAELMGSRMQMMDANSAAEASYGNYNALQQDSSGASNLALLGLANIRHEEGKKMYLSAKMNTVNDMLDEDRYFVIVMAYDRKALEEGKRPKRLWSARLSMRSPGVNFRGAMDHLSTVGGSFFGTTTEGLNIRPAGKRTGTVKLGEMKILEYKPPAAKK